MKWRVAISVLMVIMMAFSLSACGTGSSQAFAGEVFSGVLTEATGDTITVENDTESREFYTSSNTQYVYEADENNLVIGDEIDVGFSTMGEKYIAEQIVVKKHKEKPLTVEGIVTDLNPTSITVNAESLTVTFVRGTQTQMKGIPSEGDKVRVTYYGNLSEDPFAGEIEVLQEKTDESIHTVSGVISDIADDSILLSIDSSGGHLFVYEKSNLTNGQDVKLEVGDRVKIAYTGDIDDNPVVRRVTVEQRAPQPTYVIDGTIKKVSGQSIVLDTGKNIYTFAVNSDTEYGGRAFPTKGVMATITYQGDLNSGRLLAKSVYCVKKPQPTTKPTTKPTKPTTKPTKPTKPTTEPTTVTEPTEPTETTATEPTEPTETTATQPTEPTETTATEPTETTATEPTETTATEPTEPSTEPPTEPPTEPTTTQPTEPAPIYVDATGVIKSWGSTCTITLEGGGDVKLKTSSAKIASGYFPQAVDEVKITYEKNSMTLTSIQLISRPPQDALEELN